MALIRTADPVLASRDAVALDLGDLRARGDALVAAAKQHASRVIAEARAERERILAGAREEGLAAGTAEGRLRGEREGRAEGHAAALAQSKERLAALESSWRAALADFESRRDAMLREASRHLLTLALRVARRVVHRVIDADPRVAEAQLEAAMSLITRPTRLRVAIHPDDEPAVREALPSLLARFPLAAHVEFVTDPALSRGSCVARSAGGEIDASIDAQLDAIARALIPPRDPPDAARAEEPAP